MTADDNNPRPALIRHYITNYGTVMVTRKQLSAWARLRRRKDIKQWYDESYELEQQWQRVAYTGKGCGKVDD